MAGSAPPLLEAVAAASVFRYRHEGPRLVTLGRMFEKYARNEWPLVGLLSLIEGLRKADQAVANRKKIAMTIRMSLLNAWWFTLC